MFSLTLMYYHLESEQHKQGIEFKRHPLHTMLMYICLRGWEFHAKLDFFFNIFSGDLYFNAIFIEPL